MGKMTKWTTPTVLVYLLAVTGVFGKVSAAAAASAADFSKRSLPSPKSLLKWNDDNSWRGGASSSSSFRTTPTPRRTAVPVNTNPTSSSSYYSQSSTPQQPQQQVVQGYNTPQKQVTRVVDSFLTRDSRQTFIARVYAILAIQLVATAGSIFLFGLNPTMSQWMSTSGSIGLVVPTLSLLLSTVTWFIMCISSDEQRRSKLKWTLLTLFTTGEAISVGYLSSFFKFRSVLLAMLTTAVATASVSIYTISQRNSQYDLSQWGSSLSSCGLVFLCYGTLQLLQLTGVLPKGFIIPYNEVLYSIIGATLFSFYLAHHTKLIVSGKYSKYQMNEKDYVFGAMSLYNDIISIFIYVLKLIGEDKDE